VPLVVGTRVTNAVDIKRNPDAVDLVFRKGEFRGRVVGLPTDFRPDYYAVDDDTGHGRLMHRALLVEIK
jgi:hypothetical protein